MATGDEQKTHHRETKRTITNARHETRSLLRSRCRSAAPTFASPPQGVRHDRPRMRAEPRPSAILVDVMYRRDSHHCSLVSRLLRLPLFLFSLFCDTFLLFCCPCACLLGFEAIGVCRSRRVHVTTESSSQGARLPGVHAHSREAPASEGGVTAERQVPPDVANCGTLLLHRARQET